MHAEDLPMRLQVQRWSWPRHTHAFSSGIASPREHSFSCLQLASGCCPAKPYIMPRNGNVPNVATCEWQQICTHTTVFAHAARGMAGSQNPVGST